jgi:signal transduction histidine kinase
MAWDIKYPMKLHLKVRQALNRLWIRISIAITAVVLFAMLLPMIVGIAVREYRYEQELWPIPKEAESVSTPEFERNSEIPRQPPIFFPGRFILDNLAPLLVSVTLAGIIVGVLLSRGLSAPLSRLAEAARAIGKRNLSQRVMIRGTQEVQEVAWAFNEMAADLEQAETLRTNLLADVAHELRTPLSVIRGNLQAILDDVYELDKAEIARLYDQTRQLSRLVDDLHQLAQVEAGQIHLEMAEIDLNQLMLDIAEIYLPIAHASGIELTTHATGSLPTIHGDRARLTQCLQNLLNNALRFTLPGGKVSMVLESDTSKLTLKITDTGTGIPHEHLPYVFDRFYRVDPTRSRETGGTGLGLAITRAIIEAHGGDITVDSEGPGCGTTFTIGLPVL